jgi:tyrosine-protein phosphatase SIW14
VRHLLIINLISLLLGCTEIVAGADAAPVRHIRNFGQVNANLYRGAEPSSAGLAELQGRSVRWVIDLRQHSQQTLREQREVENLGMHYVNVPFRPWSAPTPGQIRAVLTLLLNRPDQAIFVHCRRGKDRTGTVIACYRIQHDGWTDARALEEANHYGMSQLERAMRSFVLHFSPLSTAELIAAGPWSQSVLPAQP